tara:strand:- start:759 stop:968 length:210 start_codon:yes stop_codon:yes gene_type:complete
MGNIFSENKSLIIENNNLKKRNQQLVDDIEAYQYQVSIMKSMIKIDDDVINEYEEEKGQNNCILCQFIK